MHKIIRCHCDSLVGVSLCISFDARRTILLQIFARTRVAPLNTRCVQPKLIVDEIVETTENGFASSCHYKHHAGAYIMLLVVVACPPIAWP
jgi:hypothetical protein